MQCCASVLLAAGTAALPAALQTWLRVALGFHTWPQVAVGAGLGAATAACWFTLGVSSALPALQQSAAATAALFVMTGLAMAAFAVKNVLAWADERMSLASAATATAAGSGASKQQRPPTAARMESKAAAAAAWAHVS